MEKLADIQLAAFVDELEKIALAGGLSETELALLKEAGLFGNAVGMARRTLGQGAGALAGAAERGGMGGASRLVHAFNADIGSGAAGRGLVEAGKHISSTAAPGALGGLRYGVGQAIEHKGSQIAGGGAKGIVRAGLHMANPIGTLSEIGATGLGHATSRAANLSPTGLGHNLLTKQMPRAAEMLGGAGAGLAVGAPMGLYGAVGHGVMGGMGHLAPAAADAAGHVLGPLGEAGGEFAHHIGADILGSHGGHHALGRLKGMAAAPAAHA